MKGVSKERNQNKFYSFYQIHTLLFYDYMVFT